MIKLSISFSCCLKQISQGFRLHYPVKTIQWLGDDVTNDPSPPKAPLKLSATFRPAPGKGFFCPAVQMIIILYYIYIYYMLMILWDWGMARHSYFFMKNVSDHPMDFGVHHVQTNPLVVSGLGQKVQPRYHQTFGPQVHPLTIPQCLTP